MISRIPLRHSLLLLALLVGAPASSQELPFVRGDTNTDQIVDVSDSVKIILHLFLDGSPDLDCLDAADVDDTGDVTITDPIVALSFLFQAGPPPRSPFPACGWDTTPDDLSCERPGCQPDNCSVTTPWEQIADSLTTYADLLPTVPTEPLPVSWDEVIPAAREDWISPTVRNPAFVPDETVCDPGPYWPTDRVQIGPLVTTAEGDHCRVRYRSNPTDAGLFFVNRHPTGSIHVPISGEPAWARFRFPVPPAHEARGFTWSVSWARLFGSRPDPCNERDRDEMGNCTLQYLAEDEDWSEEVPAGLFLLWATPGDCPNWVITGPHAPAADISYSGVVRYETDVPVAFRDVEEVVVSLLVYRQYPGGCDGANCVAAQFTYHSLAVNGAMLRTEEPFAPDAEPPVGHPRLFGDDASWLAEQAVFDALPCRGAPDYEDAAGWGSVTNVRAMWDIYTKGGRSCEDEVPTLVADHPDAGPYLDGSAADSWSSDRAHRALHLIRRVRACHATTEGPCQFSLEDMEPLITAFVDIELARFDEWNWSGWSFGFDLRTEPTLRYWSLFVDTLWSDLTEDEHALIGDEMLLRARLFLENYEAGHWSLYNGNNWTPVLAKAALYWAITYYWEEEIAPEVARRALQSLWLHDGFYLQDGAYLEGLMVYTQVSFNNLQDANRLSRTAFGAPLDSVDWTTMPAVADWALAFIAPDGLTVDFGDSWAKRGWGNLMPLAMMLHEELTGVGLSELDPCRVRSFFSNKYYDWGLRDPWFVDPALARDWGTIVEACPNIAASEEPQITVLEEGGWGAIRVGRPGSTETAASGDGIILRYQQADQTYLAVSAIPNERPHTELDFGTVIWTAYGNRLLWDLGYGSIGSNLYESAPDYPFDNNPTGHNTLVIPEAVDPSLASTNTSQIDGVAGTIARKNVDGVELIHLDGATVYGRDDPELGWLESFDRRLVPLSGGHFLIIDAFEVRADRPDAAVQEYWYSFHQDELPDPATCRHPDAHVALDLLDPKRLQLEPVCSNLGSRLAESAGLIVAEGLASGSFVHDEPISYVNRLNNTEWRGRVRWVPDAPVRSDLRVFALISAPGAALLPEVALSQAPCGDGFCFTLVIDDAGWSLEFGGPADGYPLTGISSI